MEFEAMVPNTLVVRTRPVLTQVLSGEMRGEGISAARGNDVTQDGGG